MRLKLMVRVAGALSLSVAVVAGVTAAASARTGGSRAAATNDARGVGGSRTGLAAHNPFCKRLGKTIAASPAAWLFCDGAQVPASGPSVRPSAIRSAGARNVDAASLSEDVGPGGARGYGQSETSIAAAGPYVVEAWNDMTTLTAVCGAPQFKEEATGIGFSANGGRSFTDLGGVRNPNCKNFLYEGDPSVSAYQVHGHTYFYISSLYDSVTGGGLSEIAFDACQVVGAGSSARLRCGSPIVAASSKQCVQFEVGPGQFVTGFCSFLDKDFIAIDPARGRLYDSYTEFPIFTRGNVINTSACDLGHNGGRGPLGGTPARPVCATGSRLKVVKTFPGGRNLAGKPYLHVAGPGFGNCEIEGSYPATDPRTGALYVAYQYNWATNLSQAGAPNCQSARLYARNVITWTAQRCLQMSAVSPCAAPGRHNSVLVDSMDGALIPGYDRFPPSDFPRVAVSDRYHTVSMVWNDTRDHALGDILLQSFRLGTLARVQAGPVVLDRPHGGGLSLMPGLKESDASGRLDVVWYSRANAQTPWTDVIAAIGVNPTTTRTPANIKITTVASNWLLAAYNPVLATNFGDYSDAAVSGNTFYVAWSDGRFGYPQPFEAHIRLG